MANIDDCPEIELLRRVVPLLKKKVHAFEKIVSSEFIDAKRERQVQQGVRRELERLEETRALAESVLASKSDMDEINQFQKAIDEITQETRVYVVRYQRSLIAFDARQDEYDQSSALARQFMTPRTRFARAWEAEELRGADSHPVPEVNFLVIILVVFAFFATCSIIVSLNPNIRSSYIVDRTLDNMKQGLYIVKEIPAVSNAATYMKQSILCRVARGAEWTASALGNYSMGEL